MPAIYQLLGFPGTGKYTVAQAIVEQLHARGEPAALLDNHATANLVWSLVPVERRFDADVMGKLAELRNARWDAAAELTSPDHSLVFTNFLPEGRPPTVLDRHRELAQQLGRRRRGDHGAVSRRVNLRQVGGQENDALDADLVEDVGPAQGLPHGVSTHKPGSLRREGTRDVEVPLFVGLSRAMKLIVTPSSARRSFAEGP